MTVVAWPPPTPPNTRANITPILDAHPADHNKIADALDTIIAAMGATPWIALPLASGFVPYGSGYTDPQYRKIGDMVQLRGTINHTTAIALQTTVFTMPVGYRPLAKVQFGVFYSTALLLNLEMTTDGVTKLVGISAGSPSYLVFDGVQGYSLL